MVEDFSYLWQEPKDRWRLVRLSDADLNDPNDLVIEDVVAGNVLIIEDDDVYRRVIERMIEEGVPILDHSP